jgi:TolA-binding protein
MWCRLPATGESGAIEINHLEGTNNWVSCQIAHVLQKGERPDLIRLNVVIEGEGDVRAKDIEWCTIANPPPPAASAEPASAASTENPNPPTPPRQPAPDPNDASELSQEGWRLWQAGQFQAAIVKFKGATNLAPNDANSWNGLGWASFNSGKIAEAEKAFQKVISLQPNHAGALNGLGQIYLAQRKYETAEPFLLKAAQQPGASAAWFGLARLYVLEGKYDDAGKWAQMLVDSGQGDALATKMLEAAKEKQLRDGLRQTIEPPVPAKSEGDTSQPPKVP